MSGYAVVQFNEWGDGNSAEAVPVSWLVVIGDRHMCYYPKTGIKKAIRSCSTPRGDWELHAVRRLSHKEIVSYKTAREKEQKACHTSGIDTEDGSVKASKSSRKRKRPTRYHSSESEAECRSMGEQEFQHYIALQMFCLVLVFFCDSITLLSSFSVLHSCAFYLSVYYSMAACSPVLYAVSLQLWSYSRVRQRVTSSRG